MKAEELELLKRYFPESSVAMVGEGYSQRRFKLLYGVLTAFAVGQKATGRCFITVLRNRQRGILQQLGVWIRLYERTDDQPIGV